MTVTAAVLRRAIDRVTPVAAASAKQTPFHCVLLDGDGDRLRLTATDKTRLTVVEVPATSASALRALVPARDLRVDDGVADDAEIELDLVGDQLELRSGDVATTAPVVGGEFPNVEPFLARDPAASTMVVSRDALVDALESLDDDLPAATFAFRAGALEVGPDALVIEARYDGDVLQIALNPEFVHQAATSLDGDEVAIDASDPLRPVVLRSTSDEMCTAVIMPIRLR